MILCRRVRWIVEIEYGKKRRSNSKSKWERGYQEKEQGDDDLLFWPYGAGRNVRRGKERRGWAERAGGKVNPRKRQQLVGGASSFLFLAIILYKNT